MTKHIYKKIICDKVVFRKFLKFSGIFGIFGVFVGSGVGFCKNTIFEWYSNPTQKRGNRWWGAIFGVGVATHNPTPPHAWANVYREDQVAISAS